MCVVLFCLTYGSCSIDLVPITSKPRERLISVTVVDHRGTPLKNARLYLLRDETDRLSLRAGRAIQQYAPGKEDTSHTFSETNNNGIAQVDVGNESVLAVTHASFDAWARSCSQRGDQTADSTAGTRDCGHRL